MPAHWIEAFDPHLAGNLRQMIFVSYKYMSIRYKYNQGKIYFVKNSLTFSDNYRNDATPRLRVSEGPGEREKFSYKFQHLSPLLQPPLAGGPGNMPPARLQRFAVS